MNPINCLLVLTTFTNLALSMTLNGIKEKNLWITGATIISAIIALTTIILCTIGVFV